MFAVVFYYMTKMLTHLSVVLETINTLTVIILETPVIFLKELALGPMNMLLSVIEYVFWKILLTSIKFTLLDEHTVERFLSNITGHPLFRHRVPMAKMPHELVSRSFLPQSSDLYVTRLPGC